MGDIADILGVNGSTGNKVSDEVSKILGDKVKVGPKAKKPKGMSREVFRLLGNEASVSAAEEISRPSTTQGFKLKRNMGMKGRWSWAPIINSARETDNTTFRHWIRTDSLEDDYPFAKFNYAPVIVSYTDFEYEEFLLSKEWSRKETDYLMNLCCECELRWPLIVDRYHLTPTRAPEEIMERYFFIVNTLKQRDIEKGDVIVEESTRKAKFNTGSQIHFNRGFEKRRRYLMDIQFKSGKDGEVLDQLQMESILNIAGPQKKIKISQEYHNANLISINNSSSSSGLNSAEATDSAVIAYVDVPTRRLSSSLIYSDSSSSLSSSSNHCPLLNLQPINANRPKLRSEMLIATESSLGLSKPQVNTINSLLKRLGAPEHPIPTEAVAVLYDQVRKDARSYLTVQATLERKMYELEKLKS